jgi:hypothetical protein
MAKERPMNPTSFEGSPMPQARAPRTLRRRALAIITLGLVLLAIGWSIHNDLMGFFFMVCLLIGLALLGADALSRRRKSRVESVG